MTIEEAMREALTRCHRRGLSLYGQTLGAVIDQDEDGDGKLDDNPDTGPGVEAGMFTIFAFDWPKRDIRWMFTEHQAAGLVGDVERIEAELVRLYRATPTIQ